MKRESRNPTRIARRQLSIILSSLCAFPAVAQWQSVGNVDAYRLDGARTVVVTAGKSILRVSILAPDLFRIHLAPRGTFLPDRSWAVVKTVWPEVHPSITETAQELKIGTDECTVVIAKRPLRLSFIRPNGEIINQDDSRRGMAWDDKEVRVWKTMPLEENYYGFGEKAGSLNRKFRDMAMWNSDIPAYGADTDPLYESIPFFYGIRNGQAYGIFFDNSYWSSFDMGKESPERYSFGALGGELDYYFISGPTPEKILSRFTELVGRMPLPPRWALGYQQCRWSYYPESRVRKLARDFRSKKIPCDVIYLDIDYMEGYRIFTWSKKNFPDPKKMIGDLAHDGFKIAVIVDPGIKVDSSYEAYRTGLAGNHFLKYPDGRIYVGKVWPGECAFPDFSNPLTQTWWGDQFSSLTDAGVRGFWNDMNEPSVFDVPTKTIDLEVLHYDNGLMTPHAKNHNLYGLQMTQATREGVQKLVPNERPFVLTRASFAGGQRSSAAWTGDNVASWEHLQMAVPMCLNLSISGQPFVGTDIGGFVGSPDGELYARWLQFAVFTPLMRTHTEINSADQEPWSFGKKYEKINRETIELRYRLLPYIYNVMRQASLTGIPAMRPLFFTFPDDARVAWNQDAFMFGKDLLIAPVLWPHQTKRRVWLPKGVWFDYWTGARFDGNKDVTVDAPINRIPIFVREGAIIPTQQVVQYSDERPIDPLTLTVYPAESSETTYYEDDGHSLDYQRGIFLLRKLKQKRSDQVIEFILEKSEGSYVPPRRGFVARLIGVSTAPKTVAVNGKNILKLTSEKLSRSAEGWSFDSSKNVVNVRIQDSPDEIRILVSRYSN